MFRSDLLYVQPTTPADERRRQGRPMRRRRRLSTFRTRGVTRGTDV